MSSVDSSFLTVLLNSFRPLLEGLEQKMDLKFEKMETNIVAIQLRHQQGVVAIGRRI